MKTVTENRRARVTAPIEFQSQGIVAFQVVEFVINFFGNEIISEHDTRIMTDGRQFVIDGCGFIADGYELSAA